MKSTGVKIMNETNLDKLWKKAETESWRGCLVIHCHVLSFHFNVLISDPHCRFCSDCTQVHGESIV